jgi:hypothetical protein
MPDRASDALMGGVGFQHLLSPGGGAITLLA